MRNNQKDFTIAFEGIQIPVSIKETEGQKVEVTSADAKFKSVFNGSGLLTLDKDGSPGQEDYYVANAEQEKLLHLIKEKIQSL